MDASYRKSCVNYLNNEICKNKWETQFQKYENVMVQCAFLRQQICCIRCMLLPHLSYARSSGPILEKLQCRLYILAKILEWDFLMMRLCECDFVHSCCELSIHPGMQIEKKTIKNQRRRPGETRDSLTHTSQTAKKVRADEARHKHSRLYKSIRGEASVSIYILVLALSRVLSARVYSQHKGNISKKIIWPLQQKKLLKNFLNVKHFSKFFLLCFFSFLTLVSNFPQFISYYLQILTL